MAAALLQLGGAVAITVGVALLSVPVACIIGGVFLMMFGIAAARGDR